MKILIAEDDITSLKILQSILTKWGYDAAAAMDGCTACSLLEEKNGPQLAILDWMMPGMDGIDVCRHLRKRESTSPPYLILLTTRDNKADIVEGLEAGANDYIVKPFDSNELRARIQVGRRVVELQTAMQKRVQELQEAMSHIRILQGILPICMHCHKIRNDQESWQRVDNYIQEHSDAQFSHSICPECLEKYYPENEDDNAPSAF